MKKQKLILSLVVLFAAVGAFAWGPEGHSIVAAIAAKRLTPATEAAVKAILGDHQLSDYEVSSWPDTIRGSKEYKEKYPNNGSWHFIDFDVTLRYNDDFELELPGDGKEIVSAIKRWRDDLKSGTLEGEELYDGLRFLTHFCGDIHQPMHCAHRYGDMGGNMIPVDYFQGRHYSFDPDTELDYAQSIHSIWDEAMVNEMMAGRTVKAVAKELDGEISEGQARWWSSDDPYIWAVDSYWRARKECYRWADGSSLPWKWARPGMTMTSDNYIDAKLPIVGEQLKKGGVRLAHSLNLAFDPDYKGLQREEKKAEKPEDAQAEKQDEGASDKR